MTTISNLNNNSQYFIKPKVEPKKQPEIQPEKSSLSNNAKTGIGLGITALVASGVYIATRGKVKPKITPEIPQINLRDLVSNVIKESEPLSNGGLKGIVYKFEHKGETLVAKVARSQEHSFAREKEVLEKIPQELNSSQRLVDYYQNEEGKDILITTFVEGEKGVLRTKEQFDDIFNSVLNMDKSGVLHNDLNMGNCLFKDGKAKIIDFGEGSIFKLGDESSELYPNFVSQSNVINLEQNGIPDCIKAWNKEGSDTKGLFTDYLKSKASFYDKHASMLENATNGQQSENLEYERVLSRVLKSPSDAVVENEARRMDILSTFEQADTSVNYDKLPNDGIKNWQLTLEKTQYQSSKTKEHLSSDSLTNDERKYFEHQDKLYEHLQKTFTEWGNGTIDWLNNVKNTDINHLNVEHRPLKENADKRLQHIAPDLVKMIFD